jgi:hypothetical protein
MGSNCAENVIYTDAFSITIIIIVAADQFLWFL